MADALDSKSSEGNLMRVQVPPPVLVDIKGLAFVRRESFFFCCEVLHTARIPKGILQANHDNGRLSTRTASSSVRNLN